MDYQTPPLPSSPEDAVRVPETRRRRRMMEGLWGQDLEGRLRVHVGDIRRAIIGPKSKAKNPGKRLCEELAVLYGDPPRAHHGVSGEVAELLGPDGYIARAGLWPLMRRVQTFTLALREELVRVDWDPESQGLTYRMVHPDTVTGCSRLATPGVPYELRELLWREVGGKGRWTYEVFNIADAANPVHQVLEVGADGKVGADITAEVYGQSMSGDAYLYRWTEGTRAGRPFLPIVVYHADVASQLWDPYNWIELWDGTLDVAAAWTWWHHLLFKASWPQRWGLDVFVAGTTPEDTEGGPRSEVPADPTSLVHLTAKPGATNPQVGQWAPSADVLTTQQAVSAFEGTVADVAGVDGAHVQKDSSDAWSGAALSISRDGKREAQKIYGPQFRPRDLELIEKSAAICNRFAATSFPEQGYRIAYKAIPLSPQELEAKRRHNTELVDAGRMSRLEAYMDEHPDVTETEAKKALAEIDAERAARRPQVDQAEPAKNKPPTKADEAAPDKPTPPPPA